MHFGGGRGVLDQFDQVVAENHLARRDRDGFADDEFRIPGRLIRRQQPHQVVTPVLPAKDKVLATGLKRFFQHFGIGGGEIGGRQHIEHLAHREFDDRLVLRRHAAHAGGRVTPPLLSQQECLCQQVERRDFPLRPGKSPVLRLRLDQGPRSLTGREILQRGFEQLLTVLRSVPGNFHFPLRRRRQMRGPVDKGQRQRDRRNAAGQARQHRVERAVGGIGLGLRNFAGTGCLHGAGPGRDHRAAFFAVAGSVRRTRQPRFSSPWHSQCRLQHVIHLFGVEPYCRPRSDKFRPSAGC